MWLCAIMPVCSAACALCTVSRPFQRMPKTLIHSMSGIRSATKASIFSVWWSRLVRSGGKKEIYMISGKVRFGDIVVSTGDYLSAEPGDVRDAEGLQDSVFFIAHIDGAITKS